MLISVELRGCVTWFIYFLDLLWVSFVIVGYVRQILGPLLPPHPWAAPKKPILYRVKDLVTLTAVYWVMLSPLIMAQSWSWSGQIVKKSPWISHLEFNIQHWQWIQKNSAQRLYYWLLASILSSRSKIRIFCSGAYLSFLSGFLTR